MHRNLALLLAWSKRKHRNLALLRSSRWSKNLSPLLVKRKKLAHSLTKYKHRNLALLRSRCSSKNLAPLLVKSRCKNRKHAPLLSKSRRKNLVPLPALRRNLRPMHTRPLPYLTSLLVPLWMRLPPVWQTAFSHPQGPMYPHYSFASGERAE
jgi:hypothetical protein